MRIRDISLPAWRKITMKKILIATFALLTALVMGLGATARCKSGIRLMLYVRNLWKISRDCVFLYCNEPRRLLHACMQKSLFGDC